MNSSSASSTARPIKWTVDVTYRKWYKPWTWFVKGRTLTMNEPSPSSSGGWKFLTCKWEVKQ